MNIKVSIPVEIGGFTGQRDQWESWQHDFNVDIEDDGRVVLEDSYPGRGRKVWFDLEELQKAVDFVKQQEGAS